MLSITAMHDVNLSAVDLNLLVALEALLSERSVTRAAERVGLSQPALSHALTRLRTVFDDPLFVRTPRSMEPTPRALSLEGPLRESLRSVRAMLSPPEVFEPAKAKREFSLASADLAEFVLLPKLMASLAAEAPGVDLRVMPWNDPFGPLTAGELDVAVGVFPDAPAGILRRRVYRDGFVCVMRKESPAARARVFDADRYCAQTHLLVAPRGTPGSHVDAALAKQKRSRRVALMVPHFLVAPHVVAGTDLVWTAPERMARPYAEKLGLVVRPMPVPVRGFTVSMVWHARHDRDPAHAWLRAQVAAAGED